MKYTIFIVALLSGCASTKETSPITQHEAVSVSQTNCATAIKDIAISTSGDAASKVAAVGAIERLCGQSGNMMFAQTQQAPSLGVTLWQAALSVADIGARWYGIKAQRDVGITQSNNSATTAIASYGAFQGIASSGFSANTAIASRIQAPAPNINLSGTGVIGSGSYIGPRNCVGGAGQAGSGTPATATNPAVPGSPAPGGPANC